MVTEFSPYYLEIGGRNAKIPVLISGVASPSFLRFNFWLPTRSPFTDAKQLHVKLQVDLRRIRGGSRNSITISIG